MDLMLGVAMLIFAIVLLCLFPLQMIAIILLLMLLR